MENNRPKWNAIAMLLAVFALGLCIGALGMRVLAGRVYGHTLDPQTTQTHEHGKIFTELTHDLSLTPDQQNQVQAILDDTRARFQAVDDQNRPQYDAIRQQGRTRIRAVLTPDQLPKFEEFLARIDAERKKRAK
jgi:Spy/CpxP family protein refolding chaperone